MNLQDKLKFEKELFFLKYLLKKPFKFLGGYFFLIMKDPKLWLGIESILLAGLIFRKIIIRIITDYKPLIDWKVYSFFWIMVITYVLSIYFSQEFQGEYHQEKEEKIKNAVNNGRA